MCVCVRERENEREFRWRTAECLEVRGCGDTVCVSFCWDPVLALWGLGQSARILGNR